jgi:serine/threonine protein kinase
LKIYKELQDYLIEPIDKWKCNPDILVNILNEKMYKYYNDKYKYQKGDACYLKVTNNIGDISLSNFIKKHAFTTRLQLEIAFQLIAFFIYLNRIKIRHNDIYEDNVMLRKNIFTKTITFNIDNKKYSICPKYFAYPIDYGSSQPFSFDEDVSRFNDFSRLWDLFLQFPIIKQFYDSNNKLLQFNKKFLNNKLFSPILIQSSPILIGGKEVCSVM